MGAKLLLGCPALLPASDNLRLDVWRGPLSGSRSNPEDSWGGPCVPRAGAGTWTAGCPSSLEGSVLPIWVWPAPCPAVTGSHRPVSLSALCCLLLLLLSASICPPPFPSWRMPTSHLMASASPCAPRPPPHPSSSALDAVPGRITSTPNPCPPGMSACHHSWKRGSLQTGLVRLRCGLVDEGGPQSTDWGPHRGRFAQRCGHTGSLGGDSHAKAEAATSPGTPWFAGSHLRLQEALP